MTASKDIKKKLFIKLYSESDSRLLVPGSERAMELIQNIQRDDIRKIYVIASSQSISLPYLHLFKKQIPWLMTRDLLLEKVERRDIYTIKSIIDDINASIKTDQGCEIILFNGSIAGVILACFYVNAGKDPVRAIEQVRKTMPNVLLSGNDISFINEFGTFVTETTAASPGLRAAAGPRPAGTVAAPIPVKGAVRERESGEVDEFDSFRRLIDRPEPAGMLIRFRIATKIVALVALLIMVSLSLMIFLGTASFKQDSRSRVNDTNAMTARLIGERLQDEIASSIDRARIAAEISSAGRSPGSSGDVIKSMLFGDRGNFIFLGIAGREGSEFTFKKAFYNEEYIDNNQVSKEAIRALNRKNAAHFTQSFDKKIVIRNVSPDAGTPLLGISFPYREKGGAVTAVIVCHVPLDRFMEASRISGPARTFMVNDSGDCVVDPERNRVLSRMNMADVPIVKKMLLSTAGSGTMRYRDREGLYHLGSYNKLDMFGLGVVVTAAEGPVLRGVYDIQRRNFIILAIVLVAAVLGAFIFSKTLSAPIDELNRLAVAAPPGALKLSAPAEGDEIFYLTHSFREVLRSYLDSQARPADYRRAEQPAAGEMAGGAGMAAPGPARETMTQHFSTEGLKIQVTYDGPEVTMIWMGRGNMGNPGELLNPYLEGIINSMRGRDLTCDFSSLETMNAQIVQSIIKFAHIVDENRIRARFVYNKSIDWQDASFEALSAVVSEMDTISLDGRMLEKNMFILQ